MTHVGAMTETLRDDVQAARAAGSTIGVTSRPWTRRFEKYGADVAMEPSRSSAIGTHVPGACG